MKDGFRCVVYLVDDNPEYREMMMISLYSLARVCHEGIAVKVFFPSWSPPWEGEMSAMRRIVASGRVNVVVGTVPKRYDKVLDALSGAGKMKLGPMTYARFLLPGMLEKDDQCLYVDCDTLFVRDPSEELSGFDCGMHRFFRTAGVRDLVRYIRPEKEYRSDWYVNAGVILMDLDLWRRDFAGERYVFDSLTMDRHFNDQDTLNFNETPAVLPPRLNFLGSWISAGLSVDQYNELYGTSYASLQDAASDAAVLHYTGIMKPLRWIFSGKDIPERMDCLVGPYYVVYKEYENVTGRKHK